MAMNWSVFTTRAIYGLSFAAIMAAGFLYSYWSFLLLFTIVHVGGWREYLRLIEKIFKTEIDLNLKLGFFLLGFAIMLYVPILSSWLTDTHIIYKKFGLFGYYVNVHFILLIAGTLLTMVGTFQQKVIHLKAYLSAALGLLYLSVNIGLLLDLYKPIYVITEEGYWQSPAFFLPLTILLSIWVNDTMAYIVGSFIGKTPFSKISPKKTWEGTIGGAILAVATIGLLFPALFYNDQLNNLYPVLITIASIAAVAGTSGDLLESKLKRMAGVKDSGTMMPGHGGFLDRFDSLLIAVPCVWIFVRLFL
ncbi:phosphatidate cytidylyltransferase [Terrimonas rubra]|uniref:Phosphatidate cytidylyltransferase n=1 Tax=Terrimonas rubra TaxID=1035890 RepID=A0ABW5ZZR5_9BACT